MNDELQDYDLKSEGDESPMADPGSGSARWPWIVGTIVVILIVAGLIWYLRRGPESVPPAEPAAVPAVVEAPEAEETEAQLELGEIPRLVDSDAWLQGVVSQLSSHPQLAEWLATPELIRGFVVVVDNIAEGTTPAKHLQVAAPEEEFGVRDATDGVYIDPSSYRRFDLLAGVIDSLDTEGTAELYRAILPLCQQAYQDLGYPGEEFEATLERAIKRVLAVPLVDGPIEVEPTVTAYEFQDPALEELSPAAKQFLRLGPENLQRVQSKLRAIGRAIGLEV